MKKIILITFLCNKRQDRHIQGMYYLIGGEKYWYTYAEEGFDLKIKQNK